MICPLSGRQGKYLKWMRMAVNCVRRMMGLQGNLGVIKCVIIFKCNVRNKKEKVRL